MAAKGACPVMVLAVHVIGDGATDGDEPGAETTRQESAPRDADRTTSVDELTQVAGKVEDQNRAPHDQGFR